MIESTVPKPGSGRSPETQRRSGHTAWPRPAMAGRPERRFPPDAATDTARGRRCGLACDGGGTGSPGSSPAPRRRLRPDRCPSPGPPRATPPPGPPSGSRPGYSLRGFPGSAPDGRAAPVRPRPDATGNSAPLGARPRLIAALCAGSMGRDPDRAGIDHQCRAIRCVPHCRPHAPITPTAEAAMGILPVAVVGGQVPPRRPQCAKSQTRHSKNRRWSAAGHPTWPGPPGRWGSRRCPTRSERSGRRCAAVLRGSSLMCVPSQCTRKSLV